MFFDWVTKSAQVLTSTRHKQSEKLNLKELCRDLDIPKNIENLHKESLRNRVKNIVSTYRSLQYYLQQKDKLMEPEWHSWQVGMVVEFLKREYDLIIPFPESFFTQEILSYDLQELEQRSAHVVQRYNAKATIGATQGFLEKEYIWNAYEVGVILRYLSTYKKV